MLRSGSLRLRKAYGGTSRRARRADQLKLLNDAAKGFFTRDLPKNNVAEYSHFRVWAPTAEYMLAMKCISARYDSYDKDDVIFLVKHLGLEAPSEVFDIVAKYYPDQAIPVKTKFFVEELL